MKNYKTLLLAIVIIFQSCKNKERTQEAEVNKRNITIYTIGDSTMADKPEPENNPERGWCQMLSQILNDKVVVKNHAVNGRSTRSFIDENRWENVYSQLQKGDYVFIQFGHNDQKVNSPKRYTNPHTAYRHNLIKFVNETREKNAHPVLFTSIVRRNFNKDSVLVDTHGVYTLETRLVAKELNVPLVDLQYLTERLEESYGVEKSKKLHLHFSPNEVAYFPEGKKDDTHLSVLGATEVAKLAADALQKNINTFSEFVKK